MKIKLKFSILEKKFSEKIIAHGGLHQGPRQGPARPFRQKKKTEVGPNNANLDIAKQKLKTHIIPQVWSADKGTIFGKDLLLFLEKKILYFFYSKKVCLLQNFVSQKPSFRKTKKNSKSFFNYCSHMHCCSVNTITERISHTKNEEKLGGNH